MKDDSQCQHSVPESFANFEQHSTCSCQSKGLHLIYPQEKRMIPEGLKQTNSSSPFLLASNNKNSENYSFVAKETIFSPGTNYIDRISPNSDVPCQLQNVSSQSFVGNFPFAPSSSAVPFYQGPTAVNWTLTNEFSDTLSSTLSLSPIKIELPDSEAPSVYRPSNIQMSKKPT